MTNCGIRVALLLSLFQFVASGAARAESAESPEALDHFERRVRPLLIERCHACHGAAIRKPKGGLRLDSRAAILHGGAEHGPSVVPGDPEESPLIRAVRGGDPDLAMPPDDPLSPEEVAALERWVLEGAAYPESGEAGAESTGRAMTSGSGPGAAPGAPSLGEIHWAFRAPVRPALPDVLDAAWPRTPVDRFLLAALEGAGLRPAPEADRRTLIRRATFDVIGLPPKPEEVDAFLRDESPDAWERVVDRLLASPHYGERWGRHWLDVARYADTKGYVYSDREAARFVHAHTYRDWVVRALNDDMPYDRFLMLQLAADRMVGAGAAGSGAESAGDARDLAAMGYLTLGRRFLGVMPDIVDDRIDVTMRGMQGLTMACARCHDHKFDPIPTTDYYSLYGVFSNSFEKLVRLPEVGEGAMDDEGFERAKARAEFEEAHAARERELADAYAAESARLAERLRSRMREYLIAATDTTNLPDDAFYEIRQEGDLIPTAARRLEDFIRERGADDPVFGGWNRLAALAAETGMTTETFAARAGGVVAEWAKSGGANARVLAALTEPRRSALRADEPEPLAVEVFVSGGAGSDSRSGAAGRSNALRVGSQRRPTFQSMTDVAARYADALESVRADWARVHLDRLVASLGSPHAPPDRLDDPAAETLRAVVFGDDSPFGPPRGAGAIVDLEWYFDEPTRIRLAKLQKAIDEGIVAAWKEDAGRRSGDPVGPPEFSVILEDKLRLAPAHVFVRGRPDAKGAEVPRRLPELLARPSKLSSSSRAPDVRADPREPFAIGSGRLELARAIASRDNPFTARVLVNRVWMHRFGEGLVKSGSDFGLRADRPSHPELLDWLAVEFMETGWSLKRLHRMLLLSSAYRQSSSLDALPEADRARASTVDPENRLLWHFPRRRLEWEPLRDSILAVTGGLDPALGGAPFDLTEAPWAGRRTIYGMVDRQFVPGMLRVFDFANPDLHVPQRSRTTVPQQALFLMNHPFAVDRARAFAARFSTTTDSTGEAPPGATDDPRAWIASLHRAAFQREPTAREMELGLRYLEAEAAPPAEPAPPPPPDYGWRYGFGEYDAEADRVKGFEPLPFFDGEAWQGGERWPDPVTGWARVTATGGHAGNDLAHAAIRRWEAPCDATVRVTGSLGHPHEAGNGVRARVVSSRLGQLGMWELHHETIEPEIAPFEVRAGDTIDFVVDHRDDLNNDDFEWAPVIEVVAGEETEGTSTSESPEADNPSADEASEGQTRCDFERRDARVEFGGPREPHLEPLDARGRYAQAILLSNEFAYVD